MPREKNKTGYDFIRGIDSSNRVADASNHIILYEYPNFEGPEFTTPIGDYPTSKVRFLSARIPYNVTLEVFSAPNFMGQAVMLSQPIRDLRELGIGQNVHSYKVKPRSAAMKRRPEYKQEMVAEKSMIPDDLVEMGIKGAIAGAVFYALTPGKFFKPIGGKHQDLAHAAIGGLIVAFLCYLMPEDNE